MRKFCGWLCLALCLSLFQVGWGDVAWAAPTPPGAVSLSEEAGSAPCHEDAPAASGVPHACHSLHVCCWGLADLGTRPAPHFAALLTQTGLDGATPLRWTLRADRLFKPPKDTFRV